MSQLSPSERALLLELLVGERGRCNALFAIPGANKLTLSILQDRMIDAARLQLKLIKDELKPAPVRDEEIVELMTRSEIVSIKPLAPASTSRPAPDHVEQAARKHGGGRPKGYVCSPETIAKMKATREAKRKLKETAYA